MRGGLVAGSERPAGRSLRAARNEKDGKDLTEVSRPMSAQPNENNPDP